MAVRRHPTIEGAWQIYIWIPDPSAKGGRRRIYETWIGPYDEAVRRDLELQRAHHADAAPKTNPTLNEIIPKFLAWLETNRSPGYCKSFSWAVAKLRPHFGRHAVKSITRILIDDFKAAHKATPAHCNQCLDYLKVIINWAADRDMARPLPFRIEKLRHFRNIPEPPDPDEFTRFMAEVEINFRESGTSVRDRAIKKALLLTIYETGIRFVEARHIRWENIHDDGRIYLGRTKNGRARYAIISPDILALLKPFRAPQGYVFTNSTTDEPYTTIRKLIQGNAARAGVKIKGTHGLRHAMATDILEAGGDLRGAQEILDHQDIKTTSKYTHISSRRKREIIDATRKWRNQISHRDNKKAE
jgi:site-specific recombinase XerD